MSSQNFQKGAAAYLRGDYETAHREFLKAAKQGNAGAQRSLGLMYRSGLGVPKNDAEAARWYRKAAEQGNAGAQRSLGLMYLSGLGVPKNDDEATHWYRKAAEQGNAGAQRFLCSMYRSGIGVPKNDAEATRWYRKAAEQGNAGAQFSLGWMYHNGKGVSRDYIEAYKWFNLAAAQGNEQAAMALDSLQQNMTPSQIAQAQARMREWKPSAGSDAPGGGVAGRSVAPRKTTTRSSSVLPDKTGSGFFVSAEHILTNAHVIANCSKLRISPDGGGAVVRALDRENDLALLQLLRGNTERGAQSALLRSGSARLGEAAVVAGYPLHGLVGGGLNVTRGEVNNLLGIGGDSRYIQITAPVQKGNSGGPLLDGSGHVLGVVTSKLNAIRAARITGDIPQNVNFAIRAEVVRAFLDAHNVPYQTARSTEQIAAEARAYTVLIECWE